MKTVLFTKWSLKDTLTNTSWWQTLCMHWMFFNKQIAWRNIEKVEPRKTPETHSRIGMSILWGAQPGVRSTAQCCGHTYCCHGHRPHVRWWNSVGRPNHTDYNGQNIHKVGVTEYGIILHFCVFKFSSKVPKVTTCTRIRCWIFLCFYIMCFFYPPKSSWNSEHFPHLGQICPHTLLREAIP